MIVRCYCSLAGGKNLLDEGGLLDCFWFLHTGMDLAPAIAAVNEKRAITYHSGGVASMCSTVQYVAKRRVGYLGLIGAMIYPLLARMTSIFY